MSGNDPDYSWIPSITDCICHVSTDYQNSSYTAYIVILICILINTIPYLIVISNVDPSNVQLTLYINLRTVFRKLSSFFSYIHDIYSFMFIFCSCYGIAQKCAVSGKSNEIFSFLFKKSLCLFNVSYDTIIRE